MEGESVSMERAAIKSALATIAVASAVYWGQVTGHQGALILACWCVLWALFALASFRFERAEDWTYRLSAFLGIALGTVEGITGLVAPHTRAGLLWMALLHVAAFALSLAGRYQKVASKRQRVL